MSIFVRIKTNYGGMTAELFNEQTPETAENFLRYARAGFYNNTLFHRVIANFMIQGGGFEPGMYLKATDAPIRNEAKADLKNEKFTLAMARTPDPHSATSQFFINVADNDFLNHTAPTNDGFGYCVFGRLVDGLNVALTISEGATEERAGHKDVPAQDVVIESVEETDAPSEAAPADGNDDSAAATGGADAGGAGI